MAKGKPARFRLGRIVVTQGVANFLSTQDEVGRIPLTAVLEWLVRHRSGDWGDVDEHDRKVNDTAILAGQEGRVMSVYGLHIPQLNKTVKVWVITEWDRSATTVLLPEEY